MKTAKALGFKKGDFVFTGAFPGIVISDVNSATPCCEVWGFEHESGSAYAQDLAHLTKGEFIAACRAQGHTELAPFSDVAKEALK
jgi:hypothetical protein